MSCVESRNLFLFDANSQIQRQPACRLPFILEEDRIRRVGRLTTGCKLIIKTAANNGYTRSKTCRQWIKTTTCRTWNRELDINEMAINTSYAYAVVQIRTSLTTLWKNVTAQNVIKDLALLPTAFDFMVTKATK